MKFTQLVIALALGAAGLHAEVRRDSEFLTVYQEAAVEFKKAGLNIEPGVYLASRTSYVNQRRDLLNLLEGVKWDNPFGDKAPITVGYAPGTVSNTQNEIWAQYKGSFFLLSDQRGVDQRIALGVPKAIVPNNSGAFLLTPKGNGGIAFVAIPRSSPDKVRIFANVPPPASFERYLLTGDSQRLIYFTKEGARDQFLKVICLAPNGDNHVIAEVAASAKLEPELSLEKDSLLYKTSPTELWLLPIDSQGQAAGEARKIFTARSGQSILFKDNTPILQANRSGGGRAFFYIRRDGTLSEVSVARVSQTRLTPEEHQILNTVGADWGRLQELGQFDDIIPRPDEVGPILNALKAQNNTWVNILGADGVGKSELLRLVAKQIALESRTSGDWSAYSVYHVPLSAIISLKAVQLPPNTPPSEHPLAKLMNAIIGKQVVVLMDDFLDDPALGPSNPGKAMDAFLSQFRSEIEKGKLKIVTTANSQVWSKVADGSPQFARMSYTVTLPEPSREMLQNIFHLQIRKLERIFRVSFDPHVIEIIQTSAADLYPDLAEPKRSIKAAEDLARSLGSTQINVPVKRIAVQDARSFFLRDVVSSRVLEGLDPEKMRRALNEKVFGQSEAIDKIVEQISSLSLGVVEYEKPLAKMLLVGSTGTGKSYTSEMMADYLALPRVKIDMNFFNGFSADSPHTRAIKGLAQRPFVLILDDIDKAGSKSVLAELRNVFDFGIYGQGTANELSLRNAIIVMTANYGSQIVLNNPEDSYDQLLTKIQNQLSNSDGSNKDPEIPPHIWSRIESSIVIFRPLSAATLTEIAKTFLQETDRFIFDRFKIHVVADDAFVENVVSKSAQKDLGAVPVQNLLRRSLRTQISLHLNDLRSKNPAQFAQVSEVFVTVSGADKMRIIDNTDPRYGPLKRSNP